MPCWKNPNQHQEPHSVPSSHPQHPGRQLAVLARLCRHLSPRAALLLPLFRVAPAPLPCSLVPQPTLGRIFLACFSLTATSCALIALLMLTVYKREVVEGGVRWEGFGLPPWSPLAR